MTTSWFYRRSIILGTSRAFLQYLHWDMIRFGLDLSSVAKYRTSAETKSTGNPEEFLDLEEANPAY